MKDTLKRISRLRALVIGDIMLDHYIWGDAVRISPEAPVPVVRVERDSYALGGAANVAANIRSLGARVEIWGWLGKDEPGKLLLDMFREKGISYRRSLFVSNAPTIVKTRVLAQRQQLCRLDREPDSAVYPRNLTARIKPLLGSVASFDVVIFSDYAKGFLNDQIVSSITRSAHAAGRLVALDPKPIQPLKFYGLDLMTPNRKESLQLAGLRAADYDRFPAEAACKAIWRKYRPKHLVITMGEGGMLLSEKGSITRAIPTVARQVYDVSGAGDTIIATISLALAANAGLDAAAHLANAAAGVVVGKIGTATASPGEILAHPCP